MSNTLENGWITPGTRYVLVSMNVYNGNETGLLGVLRLEFAFTASGVVLVLSFSPIFLIFFRPVLTFLYGDLMATTLTFYLLELLKLFYN